MSISTMQISSNDLILYFNNEIIKGENFYYYSIFFNIKTLNYDGN